jgi:hypothetical protein
MLPPAGGHDLNLVQEDAPLTEWQQESAYDTAKECEAARQQNMALSLKWVPYPKNKRGLPVETMNRMQRQYAGARCIPSEHIYPPAQPPPPK